MSARTTPEHESKFRKWSTLGVLSLALAIIIIDSTLLNVSLETLVRELHTNLQSLQWVISAYALMLAALTVTGGRMGDLFGRKRMFKLGAVVFVVGAVVASISNSVAVLLIGESIIEGIGAALMMPATASLLVAKYRGHDRAMAFGIWGGVAAAASAIGPILGGFFTAHYSWRWGFRINVVVCAILLVGSRFVEDRQPRENKSIDWTGVLLSAAGLFFVVFGIIESETYGWIVARKPFPVVQLGRVSVTPIAIVIGALILVGFAFWEKRVEARGGLPIVSMHLFRNGQFVSGASVVGVLMLAQNGVIFALPVFLQGVEQLDAFRTGLTLLPMSLMLLIVSPTAAKLTKRIDHKRLVQTGLIINTIAIVVMRYTIAPDMNLTWLIPGLALYGIGMGLVLSQINNLTLSAVSVREAGEASGVLNTFRQVGISLGSAIIGAVLISTILVQLDSGIARSAAIPPQSKHSIVGMLAQQSSGVAFGDTGMFNSMPPQTRNEMMTLRRAATTAAIQRAFWFGAGFALLGLGVASFLPRRPREHAD
ncbi:MAG TPA: MFS transporter [Thermoanaerobaculia bacterium]|nr:MFS transporter [Thermoanaerobaculia bacterium]